MPADAVPARRCAVSAPGHPDLRRHHDHGRWRPSMRSPGRAKFFWATTPRCTGFAPLRWPQGPRPGDHPAREIGSVTGAETARVVTGGSPHLCRSTRPMDAATLVHRDLPVDTNYDRNYRRRWHPRFRRWCKQEMMRSGRGRRGARPGRRRRSRRRPQPNRRACAGTMTTRRGHPRRRKPNGRSLTRRNAGSRCPTVPVALGSCVRA